MGEGDCGGGENGDGEPGDIIPGIVLDIPSPINHSDSEAWDASLQRYCRPLFCVGLDVPMLVLGTIGD